jgi:hypothetical protein
MTTKFVEETCRNAEVAFDAALSWVSDARNFKRVSQDRSRIERIIRRNRAEVLRLEKTVGKSACVGVFGPSQAGKSYLISVLARKDGADSLIARFDRPDQEIDFISRLNPLGGEEATGLVTRFTIHPQKSPDGFPVCVRLLSQCDLIKILLNSYFQDGDQEYENAIDSAELEQHIAQFQGLCAPAPVEALSKADIWEVQEYCTKHSAGASTAKAIEAVWEQIAEIAPRLPLTQRGDFLSILWGRHQAFTAIYDRLARALSQLGFAPEAFCTLDSLLPAQNSILNVNTLDGLLGADDANLLSITTESGVPGKLPRAVVAALSSELRIVCRDEPQPYFSKTDLLDFPGYRARKPRHLEKYFREAPEKSAKDLYLRGKVDYLFQSYTADIELTSLILCLPDSNLEVPSLPKAIENWVAVTHGPTPEKRVGKPVLLFFTLTKFDRHLSESAGEEGNDPALRFETRLNASLLTPFAEIEPSWPKQWTPGRPFTNLFWIRNPNFKAEHVITYDDRREVALIPEREPRIRRLRDAFVESAPVRTYFRDPERSWDEAMRLNDGGVSYLADSLSIVATQDLKLDQVRSRLAELCREVIELLRQFYIDDDYSKRRDQRLAIVDNEVFMDLNVCAERMTFGSALRGLMVDSSDLFAQLAEAVSKSASKPDPKQGNRGGLFTGLTQPKSASAKAADKWTVMALATLNCWTSLMFKRVDEPAFSRRAGIRPDTLKEIVSEFGNGARRVNLAERIAEEMRNRTSANDTNDATTRKLSVVSQRIINRFVAELDFDRLDKDTQLVQFGDDLIDPVFLSRPVAYDTADLSGERPEYAVDYMVNWGKAFRATVAQNAMSLEGLVEDPRQNARLGEILAAIPG